MGVTYIGCVYANPVADPAKATVRDITVDEIKKMNFIGLPVRVEHEKLASPGKVTNSWTDPVTGYTSVEMTFDESFTGEILGSMIDQGTIKELSLCHDVYNDDNKTKVLKEVSLVNEGARPGTVIYRNGETHDDAVRKYISTRVCASKHTYEMSSELAAAPVVPAAVAAPAAVPPPVAAAAPAVADEPPAKRHATIEAKVEALASNLKDEDKEMLYQTVYELAKNERASREKAILAEAARAELETRYTAVKDSTKGMASQLATVMNDLYKRFLPQSYALNSDEESKKVTAGLEDLADRHPSTFQHLQKMQVACSKIMERESLAQEAINHQKDVEAKETRERAENYRKAFMNLGADGPWMTPPTPLATHNYAHTPAPPASPFTTVAASAHTMQNAAPVAVQQQQQPASLVPDWLRKEIGGYGQPMIVRKEDIYSLVKPNGI